MQIQYRFQVLFLVLFLVINFIYLSSCHSIALSIILSIVLLYMLGVWGGVTTQAYIFTLVSVLESCLVPFRKTGRVGLGGVNTNFCIVHKNEIKSLK